MWTYRQSTGVLLRDGLPVGQGYAGHGAGKNNPALQNVGEIGPLPRGRYRMERALNSLSLGPSVIPLAPLATNVMFGRGGFFIHGDSVEHPGQGSCGCICLPLAQRLMIIHSGDADLEVIE